MKEIALDTCPALSNSISLVQRLHELSKDIEGAEFKSVLANLANELAETKLEAVRMEKRIATLQTENRILKATAQNKNESPVGIKWGCYQFKDDDGLYCPGCWDSKHKKVRTNKVTSKFRACPSCAATINA